MVLKFHRNLCTPVQFTLSKHYVKVMAWCRIYDNTLTGIIIGLMLGFCPANERRRYKVTPSLIGWAQICKNGQDLRHHMASQCNNEINDETQAYFGCLMTVFEAYNNLWDFLILRKSCYKIINIISFEIIVHDFITKNRKEIPELGLASLASIQTCGNRHLLPRKQIATTIRQMVVLGLVNAVYCKRNCYCMMGPYNASEWCTLMKGHAFYTYTNVLCDYGQ